jgi:Cu(I)/Ag(I) efflux system membrane fusion protein
VGRVAVDERRLHHIHTKYDGYVEHLYVDFTGKYVERGDHLLSIYSPDLVATQQEYLLAYSAQKTAASGIPSVAQGSLDLLEATRQRLLLWGHEG